MQKKYTQTDQVIEAMRCQGGYATLACLYQVVNTSSWGTKTPQESIRRIVQKSAAFFRIEPGLWALEKCREKVLIKFSLQERTAENLEIFTHGYYQGLITEIGHMRHYLTYVPAQDQHRMFIDKPLIEVCDTIQLPAFSYPYLINRARTVDAIWFNGRGMPDSMFEVEHSTDIQNSITKFCDLQDFNCRFFIVAAESRYEQFKKIVNRTAFKDIKNRVSFSSYEAIVKQYNALCILNATQNGI